MGYLFKNQCTGGTFWMPQWLYDGGIASDLSPSARVLLEFFYHVLNRTGAPCFEVSERVIVRETRLTPKTIRKARRELERAQLLTCAKAARAGAPCVFRLLNPETKQPFPPQEKAFAVYDPERREKLRAAVAGVQDVQPRATTADRTPRVTRVEQKPIPPDKHSQSAVKTQTQQDAAPVCAVHGDEHVWFSRDGSAHCGICEPDPYAPKAAIAPSPEFVMPTAKDLFGA